MTDGVLRGAMGDAFDLGVWPRPSEMTSGSYDLGSCRAK